MAPILDERSLDFISHSPAQTRRIGARLGALVNRGDVLCLVGELGTGKTCLIQGLGRGLEIEGPITSPTFTLINEYRHARDGLTLYHIDLYRISDVREALDFGLDEYLYGEGVCAIEWAERAEPVLPDERLWIVLRHLDVSKRGILIRADGPRYETLLRELKRVAFGI
ncbi:MAG: tRNA (adenosine(37)-N6)-threonylcarbamoyltransferase complex ATPase subunit type 1 TsaE [Chloroflexi bacterium]|nr:MAG: tRNA (adenosine(37)-N6)-threonylcarbamoyltransferase complex ATPase subunit type 1 TsaE [Chloroflexota bacterium]